MYITPTETNSWCTTKMDNKKKKLYTIQGSKKEDSKTYKDNLNIKVVSYDIESAIRLAKESHPGMAMSQITLKEVIDIIDPEIILEMFENKEEG